jgi:2-keto-3-deoxy-L-rhamnonate aldolase RhmA
MRMKSLKQKIAERQLTIGSWLSFGYTPVCEIMARAGFDWLVIDMEHTAIDIWQAQQLIQICDLADCPPLVRVGSHDPLLIKRVMDAGAHGVLVPLVNTKTEAQQAVASIRYPPLGNRGVGLARAQGYGMRFEDYKDWLHHEAILIVQIEHVQGVENLEAILAVEGVDGFIIGPYDLSGSLGRPGDFEHPDVKAALDKVQNVVQGGTKVGGYHVVHTDHQALKDKVDQGYKFIAYGDDMVFFAEKVGQETDFVKHSIRGE